MWRLSQVEADSATSSPKLQSHTGRRQRGQRQQKWNRSRKLERKTERPPGAGGASGDAHEMRVPRTGHQHVGPWILK